MAPNLKPINRRALRRYGEFWRALALVGNALAEAEQLAAKASDAQSAGTEKQTAHWSAPTPDELRAAAKKAGRALHTMSSAAKKWEAELVSREWRR
ncbi:hypothetical protein [Pseudonocardia sp. D17]|uniref:hypothetical protein n=1 Tax=Pseudonocardia sp. D17 TaxID=882661 RepID=UPI0030CE2AAE